MMRKNLRKLCLLLFVVCLIAPIDDGVCDSGETSRFLLTDTGTLKVRVIAPASGCDRGVVEKLMLYKDLNISPLLNVIGASPFHSNTDDHRAADLISALHAKERYIWAMRGGYGSAKLIPYLSANDLSNDRVIIGYSDITALHLMFNKYQLKSIHGANLNEIYLKKKDPMNILMLKEVILGKRKKLKYQAIKAVNKKGQKSIVTGSLIGGNLTLIISSIGTSWEIETKGKILFVEDVGIKGYALDRSLNHLIQSGVLKDVKAVLFGTFEEGDKFIEFAINQFAMKVDIPVYTSDQFGHGYKNYPLIFGTNTKIGGGVLIIDGI